MDSTFFLKSKVYISDIDFPIKQGYCILFMKTDKHTGDSAVQTSSTLIPITGPPSMAGVFLKALMIAPFRSNTLPKNYQKPDIRMIIEEYRLDRDLVERYAQVCGFDNKTEECLPISYLQTPFIGILGKFITSCHFPFNPLGLVQIYQSFEMKRPVGFNEPLTLSCTLDKVQQTPKGYETDFVLQATVSQQIVWQGVSRYLSRIAAKKEHRRKHTNEEAPLKKRETILIPAGTGRKYARVSGDYNPHHMYPVLARMFGFKTAIAHGMFSLARVLASLEKEVSIGSGTRVEARFKLPVLMPASTALAWEPRQYNDKHDQICFELRDDKKGLPHLTGTLFPGGSQP